MYNPNDTIHYLQRFPPVAELTALHNLDEQALSNLPDYWNAVLSKENFGERKDLLMTEWEK
jgi:hypothetical protein